MVYVHVHPSDWVRYAISFDETIGLNCDNSMNIIKFERKLKTLIIHIILLKISFYKKKTENFKRKTLELVKAAYQTYNSLMLVLITEYYTYTPNSLNICWLFLIDGWWSHYM